MESSLEAMTYASMRNLLVLSLLASGGEIKITQQLLMQVEGISRDTILDYDLNFTNAVDGSLVVTASKSVKVEGLSDHSMQVFGEPSNFDEQHARIFGHPDAPRFSELKAEFMTKKKKKSEYKRPGALVANKPVFWYYDGDKPVMTNDVTTYAETKLSRYFDHKAKSWLTSAEASHISGAPGAEIYERGRTGAIETMKNKVLLYAIGDIVKLYGIKPIRK